MNRAQAEYLVDLTTSDFTPYPVRTALDRGDFVWAAKLMAEAGLEVPDWLADADSAGLAWVWVTAEGAEGAEDARDVVVTSAQGGDLIAELGTVSCAEPADPDGTKAADRLLKAAGWERLGPWAVGTDIGAWVFREVER